MDTFLLELISKYNMAHTSLVNLCSNTWKTDTSVRYLQYWTVCGV